jgi:hypothetical protein
MVAGPACGCESPSTPQRKKTFASGASQTRSQNLANNCNLVWNERIVEQPNRAFLVIDPIVSARNLNSNFNLILRDGDDALHQNFAFDGVMDAGSY